MKKQSIKIYFVILIIFTILTFVGAAYVIINKGQVNAGYAVIPMLLGITISVFYRQELKKEKEY